MHKVTKTFVCRGCVNPVTGTGCTSVEIDVNANLELVDKCCYLGTTVTIHQTWHYIYYGYVTNSLHTHRHKHIHNPQKQEW